MRLMITIGFAMLCLCSKAQVQLPQPIDTTSASIDYWKNWMTDLQTMGARQQQDSLLIDKEVIRLMKDEDYRNGIYPSQYSWEAMLGLLKTMELKKAFWHLINLYAADAKNQTLVLNTLITYDSVMEMDKILLSTYYTYAFTDPRVYRLVNNKPQFVRPDLLERNLAVTKQICEQIWQYRKQKGDKRS